MTATARIVVWISASLFVTAALARRPGEPLRPGYNMFSKQQDVQLGQANAKKVLEQYQVLKNQFLQDYVSRVGNRVANATEAKQSGFQFNFTVLNVAEINAFAFPGGPMFIYTGLLKTCDNEAQLAGVMGHEMSHVILRHGTHEATKANFVQLPALLAELGDLEKTGCRRTRRLIWYGRQLSDPEILARRRNGGRCSRMA